MVIYQCPTHFIFYRCSNFHEPSPPAAASSTSSKIEIQGLALEGQLSTDEDQRNELGPLPQLDIAGALLQHQNMQAQKKTNRR